MPKIVSNTVLRNDYNDISSFCHKEKEPIFITKDGQGDLALMSIEKYEELIGKFEVYEKLEEGFNDIKNKKIFPYKKVRKEIFYD